MQIVTYVMLAFALVAAIDRIFGSRLGIGAELDKGINMLGPLTLSMGGIMVLSPYIAELLSGARDAFPDFLDFSIIPASLFANDSGGAQLAVDLAASPEIGLFNGLIVASMMGVTFSFTIPYSLQVAKPELHSDVLFGILCGMVTIPIGCFVGGLMLGINIVALTLDLLPLLAFLGIVAVGILRFKKITVAVFSVLGWVIRLLLTVGLAIGIAEFMLGVRILPVSTSLDEAMSVILNIACIMAGAFPLLFILKKLLKKPFALLGRLLGINEVSAIGMLSTVGTSLTTFGMLGEMDRRGVVLNSAFAVSAAFVFVDHLAFTMSYNAEYLPAMIVAKLLSGATAVLLACLLLRREKIGARADKS